MIALEPGADDYLAKPSLPRELLASVHAWLRRALRSATEPVVVGNLQWFPNQCRAQAVGLDVLCCYGGAFLRLLGLAQHTGEVIDKATLTRLALDRKLERFGRAVDVHGSRLRRKLSPVSAHAPRIQPVRGIGYVSAADAS